MDKGQENPDFNLLVVWLLKWAFFFFFAKINPLEEFLDYSSQLFPTLQKIVLAFVIKFAELN
jgi:hypothetical protein